MAEQRRNNRRNGRGAGKLSGREAIERVREELPQLLGRPIESVLGLERNDEDIYAGLRAGDVVWTARREMARTVEDVLARRTRALLLDARLPRQREPPASPV